MVCDISSFPRVIKEQLLSTSYIVDDKGMSGSKVLIFESQVLKISKDFKEAFHEAFMLELMSNSIFFNNRSYHVPKFFCACVYEGQHYLLMSKIDGKTFASLMEENKNGNAKDLSWMIPVLVHLLQEMWRMPTCDLPYHDLHVKLAMAAENIRLGRVDRANMETSTLQNFKDEKQLLQWLIDHKPQEEKVFSHGDFTASNIIALDQQRCALIDFTRSGISDKYQDIALLYRSLRDYGGVYLSNLFLQHLGLNEDDQKICYYILLDELF